MQIKAILLHIDASTGYGSRLHIALRLARLFEARIIGMVIVPDPKMAAWATDGAAAAALAVEFARLKQEASDLGNKFMTVLDRHHVIGEWRMARGAAETALARHAHAADLVVVSQSDAEHPSDLAAPEEIVLAGGRPVLIVPCVGRFEDVGKEVVVAWNGSREAAIASEAALPLMAAANVVTVLQARPSADARDDRRPELVRHYQRHNLSARSETVAAPENEVAEKLQLRALSLGADLIVMGAFGRSRLRETVLGGTTRDMLDLMVLPVLMAH